MNALETVSSMLDAAGQEYTKAQSGDKCVLTVPISEQGGRVEVVFSNKGKDFYTSNFRFDGEVGGTLSAKDNSSGADDYASTLKMFSDAPVKMGEVFEAKSDDGNYLGLVFYENNAEYGSCFVFRASNKKFLCVMGF